MIACAVSAFHFVLQNYLAAYLLSPNAARTSLRESRWGRLEDQVRFPLLFQLIFRRFGRHFSVYVPWWYQQLTYALLFSRVWLHVERGCGPLLVYSREYITSWDVLLLCINSRNNSTCRISAEFSKVDWLGPKFFHWKGSRWCLTRSLLLQILPAFYCLTKF